MKRTRGGFGARTADLSNGLIKGVLPGRAFLWWKTLEVRLKYSRQFLGARLEFLSIPLFHIQVVHHFRWHCQAQCFRSGLARGRIPRVSFETASTFPPDLPGNFLGESAR